jgi:hypothetical protein
VDCATAGTSGIAAMATANFHAASVVRRIRSTSLAAIVSQTRFTSTKLIQFRHGSKAELDLRSACRTYGHGNVYNG